MTSPTMRTAVTPAVLAATWGAGMPVPFQGCAL